MLPPVNSAQLKEIQGLISKFPDTHIVLVGGSANSGAEIVISIGKPLRLVDLLREIPSVSKVVKYGKKIGIRLKLSG
jgi:hypothetical protein